MKKITGILAVLFVLVSTGVLAAFQVPALDGRRVHDDAKILTASDVAELEASLKTYEEKTSNQIAIITTRDLQGETIESYANQVFRAWKLGQKDKNNGILLVISVGEKNTARIEVGYGLEGVVPDAIARAIINDDIRPLFKKKQYKDCLVAGIQAIEKAIGGEYVVSSPPVKSNDGFRLVLCGIVLLIMFLVIAAFSDAHPVLAGIIGAAVTFGTVFILLSTLAWAVISAIVGFFAGMFASQILSAATDGEYFSGGGFSGGGDNGGGFPGGGGSSGGGGASGGLD